MNACFLGIITVFLFGFGDEVKSELVHDGKIINDNMLHFLGLPEVKSELVQEGKIIYDNMPHPLGIPEVEKPKVIFKEAISRAPPVFVHFESRQGFFLIPSENTDYDPDLIAYLMWRLDHRWHVVGIGGGKYAGAFLIRGRLANCEVEDLERGQYPDSLAYYGVCFLGMHKVCGPVRAYKQKHFNFDFTLSGGIRPPPKSSTGQAYKIPLIKITEADGTISARCAYQWDPIEKARVKGGEEVGTWMEDGDYEEWRSQRATRVKIQKKKHDEKVKVEGQEETRVKIEDEEDEDMKQEDIKQEEISDEEPDNIPRPWEIYVNKRGGKRVRVKVKGEDHEAEEADDEHEEMEEVDDDDETTTAEEEEEEEEAPEEIDDADGEYVTTAEEANDEDENMT